jgi:hypothetical protein
MLSSLYDWTKARPNGTGGMLGGRRRAFIHRSADGPGRREFQGAGADAVHEAVKLDAALPSTFAAISEERFVP